MKNILFLFFCFYLPLFAEVSKVEAERWILNVLAGQQDDSIKIYIIDNIEEIPLRSFYPELKKLTNSKNDNLKLKVNYMLYKVYKDTAALNQIINFLLDKPQISENTTNIQKAKAYLKNQLRAEAARMLGSIGNKKVVEVLAKTVKDEDGNVSDASYFALAMLSQRGVIQPLPDIKEFFYSGLTDLNPKVRLQAVKYLGELKYSDAELPLSLRLKDTSKEVVAETIKSLGKLKSIATLQDLLQFKNSQEDNYRLALAEALGEIGFEIKNSTEQVKKDAFLKIKNTLYVMLNDLNGMIRVAAAKSLLSLDDMSGLEIIKKGLESKDSDVVKYCIEAIGAYGKMGHMSLIEKFAQHEDITFKTFTYVNILKIYQREKK